MLLSISTALSKANAYVLCGVFYNWQMGCYCCLHNTEACVFPTLIQLLAMRFSLVDRCVFTGAECLQAGAAADSLGQDLSVAALTNAHLDTAELIVPSSPAPLFPAFPAHAFAEESIKSAKTTMADEESALTTTPAQKVCMTPIPA